MLNTKKLIVLAALLCSASQYVLAKDTQETMDIEFKSNQTDITFSNLKVKAASWSCNPENSYSVSLPGTSNSDQNKLELEFTGPFKDDQRDKCNDSYLIKDENPYFTLSNITLGFNYGDTYYECIIKQNLGLSYFSGLRDRLKAEEYSDMDCGSGSNFIYKIHEGSGLAKGSIEIKAPKEVNMMFGFGDKNFSNPVLKSAPITCGENAYTVLFEKSFSQNSSINVRGVFDGNTLCPSYETYGSSYFAIDKMNIGFNYNGTTYECIIDQEIAVYGISNYSNKNSAKLTGETLNKYLTCGSGGIDFEYKINSYGPNATANDLISIHLKP